MSNPVLRFVLLGLLVLAPELSKASDIDPADDPAIVYLQHGSELYVLDRSSLVANLPAFSQGHGSFLVSLHRLVFESSPAATLAFSGGDTSGFLILGTRRKMEALAGRSAADAEFQEVGTLSVIRTPRATTLSFHAKSDTMTLTVPPALIERTALPDEQVVLAVNGSTAALSRDAAYDVLDRQARAMLPARVRGLEPAFADLPAFADALHGFGLATRDLDRYLLSAVGDDKTDCAFPCMGCMTAGGFYALSWTAIAAGCSGPQAMVGCLPALIAHQLSMISAMSACGGCLNCLSPGPKEPKCPPDYHDCSVGDTQMCCQDACLECEPCVPACACGCKNK